MSAETTTEARIASWLAQQVTPGRYRHSLGVRAAVTALASTHGVNAVPLRLAALLHDCLRELTDAQMLAQARASGLQVRAADEAAPVLLHGRLAAEIAINEFGLADPALLSAVTYHTAGHPRMSLSDKLFYLADHIEPNRDHGRIDELRRLTVTDVDGAILRAIELTEGYLGARGAIVDPDTMALKSFLLQSSSE
ncbi:MAG: bis(5'-nucleosyl)-tetraphosphatase (symmetrical) YqeK [Thermoleophilia bacterium]